MQIMDLRFLRLVAGVCLLKTPYAGWEDVANRREQKILNDHLQRCDQESLPVMQKSATPRDRGARRGDGGTYPRPAQVLQAVSCRRGCSRWSFPWCLEIQAALRSYR